MCEADTQCPSEQGPAGTQAQRQAHRCVKTLPRMGLRPPRGSVMSNLEWGSPDLIVNNHEKMMVKHR